MIDDLSKKSVPNICAYNVLDCPKCGAPFMIQEASHDKTIYCQKCGQEIIIDLKSPPLTNQEFIEQTLGLSHSTDCAGLAEELLESILTYADREGFASPADKYNRLRKILPRNYIYSDNALKWLCYVPKIESSGCDFCENFNFDMHYYTVERFKDGKICANVGLTNYNISENQDKFPTNNRYNYCPSCGKKMVYAD